MRLIDLFNRIVNGEELPNKIKIRQDILIRNNDHIILALQDYYYMENEENATWKICYYDLNDEIEVIEENKKIEKLPPDFYEKGWLTRQDKDIAKKINEIIDKINSMED